MSSNNVGNNEFELDLGGVEDESVLECVAADRVEYASSIAESLTVFRQRMQAGETVKYPQELLTLSGWFLAMLERREHGCLCEDCCPELYDGE